MCGLNLDNNINTFSMRSFLSGSHVTHHRDEPRSLEVQQDLYTAEWDTWNLKTERSAPLKQAKPWREPWKLWYQQSLQSCKTWSTNINLVVVDPPSTDSLEGSRSGNHAPSRDTPSPNQAWPAQRFPLLPLCYLNKIWTRARFSNNLIVTRTMHFWSKTKWDSHLLNLEVHH